MSTPADTSNIVSNGAERPRVLSTTSTLFWRVFVPVFTSVMFAGFLAGFLIMPSDDAYFRIPLHYIRLGVFVFWVLWLFLMYRTLWRLHRVDVDSASVYISNYWRTARYPWADIEKLTESRRLGRRIIHIHLKAPGRFGQRVSFLPGKSYDTFKSELNLS